MRIHLCVSTLLLSALAWPATAAAQDSVHRSATAVAGQSVRLSVHWNLNKDCSPATPPEVRVLTPPQHGSLAIRTGQLKAERVRNCSSVQAPARIVFYQSEAGYAGKEQVSYELKKADGGIETHSVTITISPAPPAAARPGAKPGSTDL